MIKAPVTIAALLSLSSCSTMPADVPTFTPSRYLTVWVGDADAKDSDFLVILDADPDSPGYGGAIASLPVGERDLMPHHTDYETPADHRLFANGWTAGRTFVIDTSDPRKPRLVSRFGERGGFTYPHSFARLSNGHRLAVFQSSAPSYSPVGGLVELDADGNFVRGTSSATLDLPAKLNAPYSLLVDEARNLVVTTSTEMGMPPWESFPFQETFHVQTWDLATLAPKAVVALPEPPDGSRAHLWPAEPRRLADGTVMVNTFTCGLFRLSGLDGATPRAEFVHAFPGGPDPMENCAVPVVIGNYWIQTVGKINGLIVLDLADPAHPVEVSRLVLPHEFHMAHWLAADRASNRLVLSGGDMDWVLMLDFDPATGMVAIDERFRDPATGRLGARFDHAAWPHGATGPAKVHGTLFR